MLITGEKSFITLVPDLSAPSYCCLAGIAGTDERAEHTGKLISRVA
jgi:hypothetical protein